VSAGELGPVQISARDIYDALVALRSSVERLADRAESITQDVIDHEQRLRAVEARQWPLPTVSVLIALTALAVGIIGGS